MRFGWGWAWHTGPWRFGMARHTLRALLVRRQFSDHRALHFGPGFWQGLGAIVLGAMLANWVWVLFAPPVAAAVGIMDHGTPGEADALFGVVASGANTPGAGVLPGVRLAGVYTGTPGFAILELDGNKQVGVTLGAEVVRGVTLVEIAADHVMLEGGGARQRVDLSARSGTLAPGLATQARGPTDTPLPPGVTPPGAMPNGTQDPREMIRRELTARGQP